MHPLRFSSAPLALAFVVAGCGGKGAPGSACYRDSDCQSGSQCFALAGSELTCMRTCSGDSPFCDAGEVCVPTDDDPAVHVCLVGGDVAIGDPCTYSWECARSGVCVDFANPPATICRPACEPTNGGQPCDSSMGETCVGQCVAGAVGYCSLDASAVPGCAGNLADGGVPDAGVSDAGP